MKISETMNDKSYFFDSYALLEIIKGNENYRFIETSTITTSVMNLSEIYYALLLVYNKETVENILKKFNFEFVEITPKIAKDAAFFRHFNKKSKLSYIDCVGYCLSLENNLVFLTGDKEFENFDNLEFVQ